MDPIEPYGTLHDDDLQTEIDLLADVMEAAAQAGRPMAPGEIDRVLGLVGNGDLTASPAPVMDGPAPSLDRTVVARRCEMRGIRPAPSS